MFCIFTFLVYKLEVLPKHCYSYMMLREAMLQSGSGFKNVIMKRNYQQGKIKYQNTL
jgi:hypothetical protein